MKKKQSRWFQPLKKKESNHQSLFIFNYFSIFLPYHGKICRAIFGKNSYDLWLATIFFQSRTLKVRASSLYCLLGGRTYNLYLSEHFIPKTCWSWKNNTPRESFGHPSLKHPYGPTPRHTTLGKYQFQMCQISLAHSECK